jgi:hypothetical protein
MVAMSNSNESPLENPIENSQSFTSRLRGAFDSALSQAQSAASSTMEMASSAVQKSTEYATRTAELVGDLNGDGKVDEEDFKIAMAKGKAVMQSAADEVGVLAKGVVRSELVRDVTSAAAVGAVIAIPLPIVGSMAGAVVGGALGAYKNLTSPTSRRPEPALPEPNVPNITAQDPDLYEKLIKFDDLRKKGILSDAEFEEQKKILLGK